MLETVCHVWTLIDAYLNPAMRDKATTCRSTACSSRNTSESQPLETQISTAHQKQPVPMCQSHVDARFPMERSASTKIRNPIVTLHKQACKMLSQWSVIWVGNTFPQGDAGLLRLLAVRNDLGPAPSRVSIKPRLSVERSVFKNETLWCEKEGTVYVSNVMGFYGWVGIVSNP